MRKHPACIYTQNGWVQLDDEQHRAINFCATQKQVDILESDFYTEKQGIFWPRAYCSRAHSSPLYAVRSTTSATSTAGRQSPCGGPDDLKPSASVCSKMAADWVYSRELRLAGPQGRTPCLQVGQSRRITVHTGRAAVSVRGKNIDKSIMELWLSCSRFSTHQCTNYNIIKK